MTFYEAAIEVLKNAARPLHYKKITEIAIKKNLLSHVGKTPEVTMGTRLIQEVQRASSQSSIVRTRPGVYALREWQDLTGDIVPPKPIGQLAPLPEKHTKALAQVRAQVKETPIEAILELEEAVVESPATKPKPSILARDPAKKKRRRRRRRRKKETPPEATATAQTSEPTPSQSSSQSPTAEVALADSIFEFLRESKTPLTARKIAEALLPRDLPRATENCIAAMLVDNRFNAAEGKRLRFCELREGRWGLHDWSRGSESIQFERRIREGASKLERHTIMELAARLQRLKTSALQHLIGSLLERLGYQLRSVARIDDKSLLWGMTIQLGTEEEVVYAFVNRAPTLDREQTTSFLGLLDAAGVGQGIVLSAGEVSPDVIPLGQLPGRARMTFFDSIRIAEFLVEQGIGIVKVEVPILSLDTAFFDALEG